MSHYTSLSILLLAAGSSTRFQANKLLTPVNGIPMYRHTLSWAQTLEPDRLAVVSQYEEILKEAEAAGAAAVYNGHSDLGISHSIHLALNALEGFASDAFLFTVCDQPWLTAESVRALLDAFRKSDKGMACLCHNGVPGNPVVFDSRYKKELVSLTGDTGGKRILKAHPEDVLWVETPHNMELKDIDYPEDLPCDL
ncbi:nucleotidyltransferase family protein [Lachnotalea sp. AF33-28]|uniref:nucleotidyltransferase family protein n=1 Tax=Lachnotalea sp. AF33-28 TaxID=2292046 RepID=UPI000E4C9951|nr:nucleotidyltransferase family protein [Lachnotalea sp. AF33-28]RHP32806.1 nucleotidyltransferase family protein [Lachnotalea sp. AF33-28]